MRNTANTKAQKVKLRMSNRNTTATIIGVGAVHTTGAKILNILVCARHWKESPAFFCLLF